MTFDPILAIPLPISGQEGLGENEVETDISYTINFILAEATDPPGVETIIDSSVIYNSSPIDWGNYITFNFFESPELTPPEYGLTITGNIPLDVFNLYSIKYVNRGSSDKLMTPITSEISDVPDNKEVFRINVDPRSFIKFDFTVSVTTEIDNNDPTDPLYIEGDPANIVEETFTQDYSLCFIQTYDMIRDWTQDYFTNRYY